MFRKLATGVALSLALVGSASGKSPPAGGTGPYWVRRPTADDMMTVWPSKSTFTSGKATVECKVNTRGVLFDCKVLTEEPEGAGFGSAAIALTPQFLMKPPMVNGALVEARVRIPMTFRAPFRDKSNYAAKVGGRPILTKPVWTEAPTQAQVAAAYPPKAAAQRLGGYVMLVCAFDKQARPASCSTIQEDPAGAGFGKAARSLVGQFMGPTTRPDGSSVKGLDVQIRFTFSPDVLDGKLTASRPFWLETPESDDLLNVFPQVANKAGVKSARVVLTCTVAAGGRLEPCSVESEEPKGYEIGKAMLPVSAKFRLSPWSEDGVPLIGGNVRVPIRYAIEDKDAPPKP
jgi:TonB family protein